MIVRSARPSDRFAIISNAAIEDSRMSFKARGLLAYLLSRPVGWTTSAERLAKSASDRDGKDAIKTALRELEEFGYLVRTKSQDRSGKWNWLHEVTDQVEVGKSAPPEAGNPQADPQDSAVPEPSASGKSATTTDGSSVGGKSVDGSSVDGSSVTTSKKDHQEGSSKTDPPPPSSSSLPDSYRQPYKGGGMPQARLSWYPGSDTVEAARSTYPWLTTVMLREVTMNVIAYCKKKSRTPDDSLWLTFVKNENRDREKAERDEAAAKAETRKASWYGVAGDE